MKQPNVARYSYASDEDRLAPVEEVRRLSHPSSWRSAATIFAQWGIISAMMLFAVQVATWYSYLLAIVLIAGRQHALAVLMHDGAHGLLFRSRALNYLICNLFLAFPLFVSVRLYRSHHLRHHHYLNTAEDPDLDTRTAQQSGRQLALQFLRDMLGLSVFYSVKTVGDWSILSRIGRKRRPDEEPLSGHECLLYAAFLALTGAMLFAFDAWFGFIVLWLLPMITVLTALFRFRAIAEHVGCRNTNALNASRTVLPTWAGRLLLAPCNINYHLHHHLFPSVPHFNLPKLHRLLCQSERFVASAHFTRTYLLGSKSVLRELSDQRRESGPTCAAAKVQTPA